MNQIMIDTNIFDKLIRDEFFPEVLESIAQKKIELVTSVIQEKELAKIEDSRKSKLIAVIPRRVIPVVGIDCDQFDYSWDHQMAITAFTHHYTFVTEDQKLLEWCQINYPQHCCLNYQQFIVMVLKYNLA